MAGKSKYTDDERAQIQFALQLHDGNVKRAARETGFPESTVRLFHKQWQERGLPEVVAEKTAIAAEKFAATAIEARDLAVARLIEVIPMSDKPRDLATVVGILDDKIVRAQGRPTHITQSTQVSIDGPTIQAMFANYVASALEATNKRENDIILAEAVEVKE